MMDTSIEQPTEEPEEDLYRLWLRETNPDLLNSFNDDVQQLGWEYIKASWENYYEIYNWVSQNQLEQLNNLKWCAAHPKWGVIEQYWSYYCRDPTPENLEELKTRMLALEADGYIDTEEKAQEPAAATSPLRIHGINYTTKNKRNPQSAQSAQSEWLS